MSLDKLTIEAPKFFPINDPLSASRQSVVAYLEKQWKSAEAAAKGQEFPEVKRKGYFRRPDNKIVFRIRVGANYLNFGDGKTDIIARDEKDLVKVIGILINSKKNRELDEFIKNTLDGRKPRKARTKKGDGETGAE